MWKGLNFVKFVGGRQKVWRSSIFDICHLPLWSKLPPGAAGPVLPVPVGPRLGRQHADTAVMNCQYWPAAGRVDTNIKYRKQNSNIGFEFIIS